MAPAARGHRPPTGADDAVVAAMPAEAGSSEAGFVAPPADGGLHVRCFSPLVEVPFPGHAAIATADAYASRPGAREPAFPTRAGLIRLAVGFWKELGGSHSEGGVAVRTAQVTIMTSS